MTIWAPVASKLPIPCRHLNMKAFAGVDSDPRQELIVVELDGIVVTCLQLTMIFCLSHRGSKRARSEAVRVDSRLRGSGNRRALNPLWCRKGTPAYDVASFNRPSIGPAWMLVVSTTGSVSMPDTSVTNARWNSGRIYPAANLVNGAPRLKLHKNRIFLVS